MRIAVIKPDHLGDLVLASAAINYLTSLGIQLTLYIASKNIALSNYLFPDIEKKPLDVPHLSKGEIPMVDYNWENLADDLRQYDHAVFLRGDLFMAHTARLLGNKAVIISDNDSRHETRLHHDAIQRIWGDYVRPKHHFTKFSERNFGNSGKVGFCIAAGYAGNVMPEFFWKTLIDKYIVTGCTPYLIGGPGELDSINNLSEVLELNSDQILIGSNDFLFLNQISKLDFLFATDSGTAHLCALSAPVISFFGGSPYRRYAPFGTCNKIITKDYFCSPCCQFNPEGLNLCLTRHCLHSMMASDVWNLVEKNKHDDLIMINTEQIL